MLQFTQLNGWYGRIFSRILLSLVIILTVLGAFAFFTIRRPFPLLQGEIKLAGLNLSVRVLRDQYGIPQIYASNQHDLFFAQGYVHAQDRFWQMKTLTPEQVDELHPSYPANGPFVVSQIQEGSISSVDFQQDCSRKEHFSRINSYT